MSAIIWDAVGEHYYETGVDHGVLYVMGSSGYEKGVAWNGLTAITESPEGAEVSAIYADNIKYLNLMSAEDFKATIEAYTYPDEFEACDGTATLGAVGESAGIAGIKVGQQARKSFGLVYRTKVGSDTNPELGYKLHIIYGAIAAPSERAYETINDSPEAITFSWELSTVPVEVKGMKPTAHLEIDSRTIDSTKLKTLEDKLFGTDPDSTQNPPTEGSEPELLLPDEIITLLS